MCVALVLAFSQRCYEVRDCTDCGPCLCLSWFCNLAHWSNVSTGQIKLPKMKHYILHWSLQHDVGLLYSKLILFQLGHHIHILRMARLDKFKKKNTKFNFLYIVTFCGHEPLLGKISVAQRMDQLQRLFIPPYSPSPRSPLGIVVLSSDCHLEMWKVCKHLIQFSGTTATLHVAGASRLRFSNKRPLAWEDAAPGICWSPWVGFSNVSHVLCQWNSQNPFFPSLFTIQ